MSALDRLAALAGIEPHYHDVLGQLHQASSDVKRTLLKAMGFAVANEAEVEQTMQTHEQRSWRRLLEPLVMIASEAQPGTVAITLPVDPAGASITWTLTEENGTAHQGRGNIGELKVIAIYDVDHRLVERRGLGLPLSLPDGYHRLSVKIEYADLTTLTGATTLMVAPRSCYGPQDAAPDNRLWGIAVQLYGLRSERNWGMGDFTDLLELVEHGASRGAAAVGLNPLHPLFPANPGHISPYSPSSRSLLNTLYIDVCAVPDFAESPKARMLVKTPRFKTELARLRATEQIDYPAVAACKHRALKLLFDSFRQRHLNKDTVRGSAFADYCQEMGTVLDQLALFDALHEHFHAQNPACWSWRDWPADYQHPTSPLVASFAKVHQERINYFKYLQWIADEQLSAVAQKAQQLGMPIGLYFDLAVGVDPSGGEAWGDPEMLICEASLGAPPDPLNRLGQNWGLAPINPVALQEQGFAPFITALRSNMRHAGALRIDHVMGLLRLYWIPGDFPPTAGVYVRYPLEILLRILALESQRHQCIVIGEDLGTVPEGFREAMARAGLLAYRVLYFERWPDGLFKRADTHPELSLVTVATHDLPTLAGWWLGRDTDLRVNLELYPNEAMKADDVASRPVDRQRLLDALLDAEVIAEESLPPQSPPQVTGEFLAATQRMLARSQGRLMVVQLEDALGVEEQANLPGTVDEHPNWRRKLPHTVEQIFAHPNVQTVLATLAEERPRMLTSTGSSLDGAYPSSELDNEGDPYPQDASTGR